MSDSINRHDAIKAIQTSRVLIDAIEKVMMLPSTEPKTGKWTVKNGELAFWDVCSVCGKMVMHKAPFYNYCPNCGAMMKEGE